MHLWAFLCIIERLSICEQLWAPLSIFEHIWAHLSIFEQIWAILSKFEPGLWAILSNFEQIWAHLSAFEHIWAPFSQHCEHFWAHLSKLEPIHWPGLRTGSYIWVVLSCLNYFEARLLLHGLVMNTFEECAWATFILTTPVEVNMIVPCSTGATTQVPKEHLRVIEHDRTW